MHETANVHTGLCFSLLAMVERWMLIETSCCFSSSSLRGAIGSFTQGSVITYPYIFSPRHTKCCSTQWQAISWLTNMLWQLWMVPIWWVMWARHPSTECPSDVPPYSWPQPEIHHIYLASSNSYRQQLVTALVAIWDHEFLENTPANVVVCHPHSCFLSICFYHSSGAIREGLMLQQPPQYPEYQCWWPHQALLKMNAESEALCRTWANRCSQNIKEHPWKAGHFLPATTFPLCNWTILSKSCSYGLVAMEGRSNIGLKINQTGGFGLKWAI